MSSAVCYNLDLSKILSSGNGLKVQYNFTNKCKYVCKYKILNLNSHKHNMIDRDLTNQLIRCTVLECKGRLQLNLYNTIPTFSYPVK